MRQRWPQHDRTRGSTARADNNRGVGWQGHDRFQHLAVFWAAPLGAALATSLIWHALTVPAGESRNSRRW